MSAHTFDTTGIDQCPFMPVFGAPALSIERGQGTELWDTNGNRYLDFLSGIAVVSLGHANPVIAEAICRQAGTLLHVSNFFTNPQATAAAVIATGSYPLINGGAIRTPGSLVVTYDPTRPNNYGVNLENLGVPPDVWVENSPDEAAKRIDKELKVAIDEAMKMLRATTPRVSQ